MAKLTVYFTTSSGSRSKVFESTDTFSDLAAEIEYGIGKTSILTATLVGELNGTSWSGGLFAGCTSLKSVDMSSCNTSNLNSFARFFNGCTALTSCDVSGIDISNANSLLGMFQNCRQLTELNVDSFDISKVTNFGYMFNNCSKLSTVYCNKDWSSNAVTSTSMFNGCTSLSGAIVYDNSKTDITYANPNTGYFTTILKVRNMKYNGKNVEDVFFNGIKTNTVFFNGNKVFE